MHLSVTFFILVCSHSIGIQIARASVSCAQASLDCPLSKCPADNQLLIQVKPLNFINKACSVIANSTNKCCLIRSTTSNGLNTSYQNWCCLDPPPSKVIQNIRGSPYILSQSANNKKRGVEGHTTAHTTRNVPPHKQEESISHLMNELNKVYTDAYIHPTEVQTHNDRTTSIRQRRENIRSTLQNTRGHKNNQRSSTSSPTKTTKRFTEKIEIEQQRHIIAPKTGIVSAEPNKPVKILYAPQEFNDYGSRFVVEDKVLSNVDTSSVSFGWNLERINQRYLPLVDSYNPINPGNSPTNQPMHIYIVDTGNTPDHSAFGGVTVSMDYPSPSGAVDCNGHGTHVSSTAAGVGSGVLANMLKSNSSSKYDVVLHAIRVLDCTGSGSIFDVISGLTWVYDNVQYPAIVSMSLGSSLAFNLDSVVTSLVNDKAIPVIVAAGNSASDACQFSPAAASGATAVGSIGITDVISSFSNNGGCVSAFAPGENVLGAYYLDPSSYYYLSGTSMSTPHVTGSVSAYTLYYQTLNALTQQAEYGLAKFTANMTVNIIEGNLGGAPNALCFVGVFTQNIVPPPGSSPSTPSSGGGTSSTILNSSPKHAVTIGTMFWILIAFLN